MFDLLSNDKELANQITTDFKRLAFEVEEEDYVVWIDDIKHNRENM